MKKLGALLIAVMLVLTNVVRADVTVSLGESLPAGEASFVEKILQHKLNVNSEERISKYSSINNMQKGHFSEKG